MTKRNFTINSDGDVWEGGNKLGHIGCLTMPQNKTITAQAVRVWWNRLLEATP